MTDRKVALITGSGTGVGAATALMLARRGYNVLINYSRSEAEARASQAACVDAGADTLLMQGDVAEDADCRALVSGALARWGRIDALVNNAGVSTFTGAANWDVLDTATFQRIFAVNALGAFQMVRACAPHLKAAQGCIVNVSSVAGSLGIGSSVPYIASKGAVNSLTLYLARALAPEVRVNAVCPGPVDTDMLWGGAPAGVDEKAYFAGLNSYAPMKRIGRPDEIAQAVLYLACDAASYVTGAALVVDGGGLA